MKKDEELIAELKQATAGLMFMSESDYPFETVCWKSAKEISPEHLRETAGAAKDAAVATESLEQFFGASMAEPEWKKDQELVVAKKYQTLVQLLKENLNDVKVYKIGEIDMPVYIIGRSAEGNRLGLSTTVVET